MRPSSINTKYTNHSIEHDIVASLGYETRDAWNEYLHQLLLDAIEQVPNPRIANVFRQYHGIEPYEHSHTLAQIGIAHGFTTERAGMLYYRAAGPIFRYISIELMRLITRTIKDA